MPRTARAVRTTRKAPSRAERLEARLTPEQKRLIERAALLRGTSLTDFVVAKLEEAAAATVKDYEMLNLRDASRELFVNMLLNPPEPNAAAKKAAAEYKERMGLMEPMEL
ncbi:MAG: DUF1778 domain-containing protein [Candidatus Acidiferrales bacterium]